VAEKRGKIHKQLLDKVKEERGYRELKNRSTRSHFCGELGLEGAMDRS
jgi:hypothetical protein